MKIIVVIWLRKKSILCQYCDSNAHIMSKRTSEAIENVEEIPEPNNLEGGDDEEEVFEGSESDSAAVDTPAGGGDYFMHTDDFRRLFVGFVVVDTLVSMRWLDKKWHKIVEKS